MTEWGEVLSGLTGDDLKRGIEKWRGKYPPNVFEFLDACEDVHKKPVNNIVTFGPRKETNKAVARAQFQKIMDKLGKRNKDQS